MRKIHFRESSKAAHSLHTWCLKAFRNIKRSNQYYCSIDETAIKCLELSLEI